MIEITEATCEADQREMTKRAEWGKSTLLGAFGGRFNRGASGRAPEMAWTADVLHAISRKSGKKIFSQSDLPRHLVIYPNSNASILMDAEDEHEAFRMLQAKLSKIKSSLEQTTNGCLIHVLADNYVCWDLFGVSELIKRTKR
jgi:hypothetical protein